VVLVTSDIVTDFITALKYFNDGNFYWGICTIVPMFAPFTVRLSVAVFEFAKVYIRKVFFSNIQILKSFEFKKLTLPSPGIAYL
jgi:hypothetical protein